jgi:lipoprotein-releasing system permease protein
MLPYELLIGLRYTRSGRYVRSGRGSPGRARNRFISFISGLATVGIALGVAALIVVLSVMNGFQKEVRDRMLGVLSHVEVILPGQPLADLEPLVPEVTRHPEVVASAPFVMGQAMMARDGQMKGILVRGIDPAREPLVSGSLSHLVSGRLESLQARQYRIVLGRELARHLGVAVGETVVLIAADGVVTPAGVSPRLRQFQVSGIFASGHFEYDSNLALIHAEDAEIFFRDQALTGLRLMLQDMQRAPDVARQLASTLPRQAVVRDWSHENRNWFAAVQVEKRMMFIILMLIIAVAAFNLVSMLVMTVSDKRGDIAILRTLGAQRLSIMTIFVVQGAWLGCLGVILGVGLGTLIAANIDSVMAALEGVLGLQVLPKGIYFIDQLPSDLRLSDVIQIGLTALALSLSATIYPSWRASRMEPAEALRHE